LIFEENTDESNSRSAFTVFGANLIESFFAIISSNLAVSITVLAEPKPLLIVNGIFKV